MDFKLALSSEERNRLVELYKQTGDPNNGEIREAFASALSVPLMKTINPQSSVRSIFQVDELPAGTIATYPKDFNDIEAVVLPRLGAIPQNIVAGDELIVPTFQVASSIEYQMTYARDGRFNIAEEAMRKLANAFIVQEETAGWATIKAAVLGDHTIAGTLANGLTKDAVNSLFVLMEKQGYVLTDIYCSVKRAADIRNWSYTTIDPWTQKEVFQAGGLGSIWKANIHVLRSLGDDEVFAFDVNRLGMMPIRQRLTTYDDPTLIRKLRIGVVAFEEIGFAVIDPRSIVKLALA